MAVDPNTPKQTKNWLRDFTDNLPTPLAGAAAAVAAPQVVNAALGLQPLPSAKAPTSSFAGVTGSAGPSQATLRSLSPGVSRYALPTGEEAQVYATRGKDGSAVFTDNADYAASVSSGRGLGRAGSPLATVPVGTNPNAEYATSTLGSRGLLRKQFSSLNGPQTQEALEAALTSKATDPESVLANTNDANLLRARLQPTAGNGNGPVYGSNGGIVAGGNFVPAGAGNTPTNLKPSDQIALLRATNAAQQGQERLNNSAQQLELTRDGLRRQQSTEDRQNANDTLNNYQKLSASDPQGATRYLVNQIPMGDPEAFKKFKDTPNGRQILDTYFNDVVRPGALNSQRTLGNISGLNVNDNKFAKEGPFDWSYLATDKNGRFSGFRTNGEDSDSTEYPAYGSIRGNQNFDQSLYNFSPAVLKILREDAANQRK